MVVSVSIRIFTWLKKGSSIKNAFFFYFQFEFDLLRFNELAVFVSQFYFDPFLKRSEVKADRPTKQPIKSRPRPTEQENGPMGDEQPREPTNERPRFYVTRQKQK